MEVGQVQLFHINGKWASSVSSINGKWASSVSSINGSWASSVSSINGRWASSEWKLFVVLITFKLLFLLS